MSMTALMPDLVVETDQTVTLDPGKCSHYIRKDKHADAYVFGMEVEAICGYVWIPTRNPDKLPICQQCEAIHRDMAFD